MFGKMFLMFEIYEMFNFCSIDIIPLKTEKLIQQVRKAFEYIYVGKNFVTLKKSENLSRDTSLNPASALNTHI